jgi:hypothetical protein
MTTSNYTNGMRNRLCAVLNSFGNVTAEVKYDKYQWSRKAIFMVTKEKKKVDLAKLYQALKCSIIGEYKFRYVKPEIGVGYIGFMYKGLLFGIVEIVNPKVGNQFIVDTVHGTMWTDGYFQNEDTEPELDNFITQQEEALLEMDTEAMMILLKVCYNAFNQIPNRKLTSISGFKDTYAIASVLSKYAKMS